MNKLFPKKKKQVNEIPYQNTYYISLTLLVKILISPVPECCCLKQIQGLHCAQQLTKKFGIFILLCVCVCAHVSICPQAATCQPCKACNGLIIMNVNIIYLFNYNLLTAGWHLVIIQLDGSRITCLLLYLLNLILFLHYFYRILAYYCYNFVLGVIN